MCVSAVATHREGLIETPPTQLSETYFTCTATSYESFTNAVGIAFADTGALVTIMPIVFIPIIFFALKVCGQTALPDCLTCPMFGCACAQILGYPPQHEDFEEVEKKDILDELATALLFEKVCCHGAHSQILAAFDLIWLCCAEQIEGRRGAAETPDDQNHQGIGCHGEK
jgi:hypothetical protein